MIVFSIVAAIFGLILAMGVMFFILALMFVHIVEPLWDYTNKYIETFKKNRRDSFGGKK